MKTISQVASIGLGAWALGATVAVQAAAPVITSFSGNGVLVCSNLAGLNHKEHRDHKEEASGMRLCVL